jgi:hypothetical protein
VRRTLFRSSPILGKGRCASPIWRSCPKYFTPHALSQHLANFLNHQVLAHLSVPLRPSHLRHHCRRLSYSTPAMEHTTTSTPASERTTALTPPLEHVIVPDLTSGPLLDLGFLASPTLLPSPTFGRRHRRLPARLRTEGQ